MVSFSECSPTSASATPAVSRDITSLLLDDSRNAIAHLDRHPVTVPLTHEESAPFNRR